MARQPTRPRKQDRAASPRVLRKSPRLLKRPAKATVTRNISPPAEWPSDVQDTRKSKTRKTVSAATIFKKHPKPDRHGRKHRKHREETPDPDLLDDFQYGIAEARATIGDRAKSTFHDVHTSFTERLATTRANDEEFFDRMKTTAETFSRPLEDETVRSSFMEGGKAVEQVFKVGDRVATFKKTIEKEAAKLTALWNQWDEVQNEYLELGIEVFGRVKFGIESPGQDQGFKKEMTLLGLEHDTRVNELEEEIESIGTGVMKKMMSSEKESNAAAKKDQARYLQSFL